METMTVQQICVYLQIKRRTFYNMLDDGRFPVKPIEGTKPRRWLKSEIDAWVSPAVYHNAAE